MAVYLAGLGLSMPQAMAGALTPFPERAGTAASLMGLVQQTAAAVVAAVVGDYLGHSAWPVAGVRRHHGLPDVPALGADPAAARATALEWPSIPALPAARCLLGCRVRAARGARARLRASDDFSIEATAFTAEREGQGRAMTGDPLSRRSFLTGISAAGGGLALAFAVPFAPARAAEEAPEVTAWLVICPDNSVVIRVARAEMGQGAQTGLAMLVAEELECDWAKVRTEFVSPEENMRRDRVWGDSVDRRQPFDRVLAALSAAGRRHGAGNADRRRRGALECAGVGMRARMSAITHRPSGRTRHVRRRRRGCGEAHAPGRRRAEGAETTGSSPASRAGALTCSTR